MIFHPRIYGMLLLGWKQCLIDLCCICFLRCTISLWFNDVTILRSYAITTCRQTNTNHRWPRLACVLCLQGKFGQALAVLATLCSAWIGVNVGTHKRSELNVRGDVTTTSVRKANKMVARTVGRKLSMPMRFPFSLASYSLFWCVNLLISKSLYLIIFGVLTVWVWVKD